MDRVLLINPATALPGSQLEQALPLLRLLPEAAYAALPWALAPVLLSPLRLAGRRSTIRIEHSINSCRATALLLAEYPRLLA